MQNIIGNLFNKSIKGGVGASLEVELSTRCSVRCPLCPRSKFAKASQEWNSGFVDINILMKFLAESRFSRLLLCGGYGDPIYHPSFVEFIERISYEHPEMKLLIETNGSHRNLDWWTRLGKVTTSNHTFSFSIDGLEDTNHIYRVNAKWSSIINGVRALRKFHPGLIQWKWILFKHNQHQVIEGYKLSKELGFDRFKLVDSNRHNDDTRPTKPFEEIQNELNRFREFKT